MKRNGIAGILAAVLLSAWSLPAGAEETYKLDPVLVTAEKRTENVQDVPVSVTAISEQQIKDSGIRSIQDVARQVPNLFIANWGFRGNSYAFIRGIGAVNNDPAIGFYVDDVNYMDSRVFDTNLFDIERIEVLRGPQGTLYGRNSLGGVVNIVTKKPDNEFHYGLEQTVGNENLYETTLYMRAPLIKDKLFFGVSGTSEQMDGYNTNDFLDKKVDRRRGLNGRMQLRWMPTDKLDVTANVDGEKVNDEYLPEQLVYRLALSFADIVCAALQHDFSVLQKQHVIEDGFNISDQMRTDDHCRIRVLVGNDGVENIIPRGGIDARDGLVENKQLGIPRQSEYETEFFLRSLGQSAHLLPHIHAEFGNHFFRFLLVEIGKEVLIILHLLLYGETVAQKVAVGKIRDDSLRLRADRHSSHADIPFRRSQKSGQKFDERRFPASVRTQKAHDTALIGNGKRQMVERTESLIVLCQPRTLQNIFHISLYTPLSASSRTRFL